MYPEERTCVYVRVKYYTKTGSIGPLLFYIGEWGILFMLDMVKSMICLLTLFRQPHQRIPNAVQAICGLASPH